MTAAANTLAALTQRRWPPRPSALERTLLGAVADRGIYTDGPWTRQVEDRMRHLTGAPNAVAFNSCTSAIHAVLIATDQHREGVVSTSAFGFLGTVTGAVHMGLDVDYVDPNPQTLVLEAPTDHYTIAVDLHGVPHQLDRRHVITDACQALGTRKDGRHIGWAGIHCWSFSSAKMVAAPDGGMVTCSDPEIADRLRELRNYGIPEGASRGASAALSLGHNWRPSELSMVMVACRLDRLEERRQRTIAVTEQLHAVADELGLWRQESRPGDEPAWHKVRIGPADLDPVEARQIEDALNDAGVPTHRWGSVPLHRQPGYHRIRPSEVHPTAELVAAGTFCLGTESNPPMTWTDGEVAQVSDIIRTITEARP